MFKCSAHLRALCCFMLVGITLSYGLFVASPAYADTTPPPDIKEADAAVLLDKGGNVLFDKEGLKHEHPASTTKVMTAMVALDSGHSLDEVVEVTAPDLGENSQMGDYASGDRVTLEELMRVMLIYSGNDAAYNIASYVAGSEEAFVDLMNKKAASIGLQNTHFANSHGLEDNDHYTCALDLARMGKYALEHYPFIAQCALMHSVDAHLYGEVIPLTATDKLLDTFYGIRGIKTGAIENAFTFVGASGRGNTQLYTAVLGCPTFNGRFDDAAALMEWGYANHANHPLARGGWITRMQPYSFDFGMKAILETEDDVVVSSWPDIKSLSYASVHAMPHHLLETDRAYGWTRWSQSNSELGEAFYTTRELPARASAWSAFTLPLFEDTQTLGRVN